jgi:hypothetical protein
MSFVVKDGLVTGRIYSVTLIFNVLKIGIMHKAEVNSCKALPATV